MGGNGKLFKQIIIWKTKTKYIFRSLSFLFSHPRHFKYFPTWVKSFFNNHNAFNDELPWLTYEAIDWLNDFLSKEKKIFEYGSGGSTLFFIKKAGKVVSVEHDRAWYGMVREKLEEKRLLNVDYLLKVPYKVDHLNKDDKDCFPSTEPEYQGMCFEEYVKAIDQYPDEFFDLVVVDGRSRKACVKRSLRKIKLGGFLMLDNSERELYHSLFSELKKFQRKDFFGLGNYNLYPWQTTVWKIN